MRRCSIVAFMALVGGVAGSASAQVMHAAGGMTTSDITSDGLTLMGQQSAQTPCIPALNIVKYTIGGSITSMGASGTGTLSAGNANATAAISSIANGTTIPLSPTSTTASIVSLWTGGTTWTAQANIKFPTVASGPTTAPESQGQCSGSGISALDISGDGNVIVGNGWVFGGPSTTSGSASGCWASRAWAYDRSAGQFIDLGNPPTVNATTPVTYTAGASTRPYAVNVDGTVIAGTSNESTGPAYPVVWYKSGGSYTRVDLNTIGAPNRNGSVVAMNQSGTIIIGTSVDFPNNLVKWTRTGPTWATFTQEALGDITVQPTWFPTAGYGAYTYNGISAASVSDDGSIITGGITWRNGSAVLQQGWVWRTGMTAPTNAREYLETLPSLTDALAKLPIENFSTGMVSSNGSSMMFTNSFVVATGATPTIVRLTDATIYAPVVTVQPCNITANNCSQLLSPTLRSAFAGTIDSTWNIQWYKRGPLNDGSDDVALTNTDMTPFGNGTGYSGVNTFNMRIGNVSASEFGSYYCRVTNGAGSTSTNIVSVSDPTVAANSVCSGAPSVSGTLPITVPVNVCAAYGFDGVPTCGSPFETFTQLWYTFTPAISGDYRINGCGVNFTNTISVYSDCTGIGSQLACSTGSNNSSLCSGTTTKGFIDRVTMTAGTAYFIRVGVRSSSAPFDGSGSFTIAQAPATPANDNCAGATAAVVGQNAFDTASATTDGASTCGATGGGFASKDVWFKFTPPSTADYRLSTCNNTTNPPFDTVLTVYSGSCGSPVEVDCNDNFAFASGSPMLCTGTTASRLERITLQGGTEYLIRIAGTYNESNQGQNPGNGAGSMSLALAPALPANDECSNAIALTGSGGMPPFTSPSTVSNAEATPQDPMLNPLGMSCQTAARRDVWYTFTTPASAPANPWRIQVCGQTSSIDFVLGLYDGCPDNGGVEIAGGCADNIGGNGTTSCVFNAPRIDRIALLPSTTYYVRVAGAFTSRGNAGTLSVSIAPDLPVNDNCSGATAVTVTAGTTPNATISSTAYTLDEATTDPSFTIANCAADPLSSATATGRDLWFSFTPPCSGSYTIQTCGSTQSDPILHVFSSCSGAALACSDNVGTVTGCSYNQSRISDLALTANVPVLIRVANTGTTRPGNVLGTLTITQAMPCQICCRGTTCTMTAAADCTVSGSPLVGVRLLGTSVTTCTGTGTSISQCCYADFDKNAAVTIDDIFIYLNAWFASSPYTKVDGNGVSGPNIDDIFIFLNRWFAGCV